MLNIGARPAFGTDAVKPLPSAGNMPGKSVMVAERYSFSSARPLLIPRHNRRITHQVGLDDVTVYFADSYRSWQKGAVENINKLIRQYIPKVKFQ